jgi:hypothetical protein
MGENRRTSDRKFWGRIKNEFNSNPVSTIMNTIQITLLIFTLSYGLVRFGHLQAEWEKVLGYCKKVDYLIETNAAEHSILSNRISAYTGLPVNLPLEKRRPGLK